MLIQQGAIFSPSIKWRNIDKQKTGQEKGPSFWLQKVCLIGAIYESNQSMQLRKEEEKSGGTKLPRVIDRTYPREPTTELF